LVMLIVSLLLMVATLFVGMEVKGGRRWIHLFGVSVQPSEFLKPAFVVVCAWLFAEHARQPEIPGNLFAILLLGLVVALLVAQPDLGQTMLVMGTWGAMFFIAGLSWLWVILLGVAAIAGAVGAYWAFPHAADRINRFITGEGDTYQVDMSLEAIMRGGWLGQGPGEGSVKRILPDSHTDFVFAVAGEEFGIVMCFIILSLFAFVVLRGLAIARREEDDFTRYALSGLVILFGFQSIINMGVNLRMMPAKGMTLPFISYGGSSLTAIAICMGIVPALPRRRPENPRPAPFPSLSGRATAAGRMAQRRILLSAGGTGGHLFPAEALAHALSARGWDVHLVTDRRAARYAGAFPPDHVRAVDSATFGSRNPFAVAKSALAIWRGVRQSSALIGKLEPQAVVGFGGYPTLPPLFAAIRRGVPTIIHEQNAVMGRTNRLLAPRVTAIAGGF